MVKKNYFTTILIIAFCIGERSFSTCFLFKIWTDRLIKMKGICERRPNEEASERYRKFITKRFYYFENPQKILLVSFGIHITCHNWFRLWNWIFFQDFLHFFSIFYLGAPYVAGPWKMSVVCFAVNTARHWWKHKRWLFKKLSTSDRYSIFTKNEHFQYHEIKKIWRFKWE